MQQAITHTCALTPKFCVFFFFNDTATTEIYTLSLHDALPIFSNIRVLFADGTDDYWARQQAQERIAQADRKSTRLNSSHGYISYAVFCLKKKKSYARSCHLSGSPFRRVPAHAC